MATPQKDPLRPMTLAERAALERVAGASSERLDRVRRARALLAVAEGRPFVQAAEQAGRARRTAVAGVVARFNRHGLGALDLAAGRGRKATYDPVVRARIVATAQRRPDRKVDGTATWSLNTLQRTLRREAFPHLGTTTIRRILEAAGSSYQQTRTWCPTGAAQRKRKAGVVTVVDPQTEQKRG